MIPPVSNGKILFNILKNPPPPPTKLELEAARLATGAAICRSKNTPSCRLYKLLITDFKSKFPSENKSINSARISLNEPTIASSI